MLTLERIYQAAHTLKYVIRKTDVLSAPGLAQDCDLYLKTENLQVTGSFKVRGSYFKISTLTTDELSKGVIACSAGNHAQGVAMSARAYNIKSTIFLPSTAPLSKIEATRQYGAEIKLIDGVYDDAYNEAIKYQKETGAVFVHPFDDIDVIAGQGTIGLELMEQLPDVDAIAVPIGGGGLISGIAYTIKKLKPGCKVYGVQASGADSMLKALTGKKLGCLPSVSTFADGIAVKEPGKHTYDFCSKYVDEVVTVTDDESAAAILAMMEKQKLVSEGAGAVAVAAIMFGKLPVAGKKVCSLVSGGNIDVNILSRVINRGLLTSGRLSDLTIEMLDKPGQLKEVSAIIAEKGANVIRVHHDPGRENTDINGCYLRISMETKNHNHLHEIQKALTDAGFTLQDRKFLQ